LAKELVAQLKKRHLRNRHPLHRCGFHALIGGLCKRQPRRSVQRACACGQEWTCAKILRKKGAHGKKQRGELSTRTAPRTAAATKLRGIIVSSRMKIAPAQRPMSQDDTGGQGPLQRVAVGRRILMRLALRAGYGDRVAGSHPAPLPQRGAGLARSGTGPSPSQSRECSGVRRSANPAPQAPQPATHSNSRRPRSRPQWDKQTLTGRRNGHISTL
jgi:hypothetical protein